MEIKVTVEKMRDGRDGFSIFFKVPPAGSGSVPVPEKITEEDYRALTGTTNRGLTGTSSAPQDDAQLKFNQRRETLVEHRAISFQTGLSETKFAEILAGPRPRDDEVDALAHWKTEAGRQRKALQNVHSKKSYKGVLCDELLPAGGDKKQWRWFIVKPGPSDIVTGLDTPINPDAVFVSVVHDHEMRSSGGASAAGYPS